ncbi:MAG: glycosyltransferase family 9 protein [Candidatus Woesearchaeota archaeon]|nr:glycosyltransferase family 9 protein [Candidatus Woesearchaeota archaeon]MDP7181022.1 glycosyltransferase family 9 protein [Candidatus Woesearchaeota archaeon]MDP7198357.1 glycosyltransferase family 9 protein [Candidatus Woesearchaeota archaeon]MDP7467459.1 glycosyltransferase family 9 protein [Candidatus Woesearchaeota archaeon]MDP7647686.1 glycosyltransferase family 9 protein [Candidatus Woesearchaeota archaeon]
MYRTHPAYWPFLFVIDVIGSIFFFWLRFVPYAEPQRILVLRLELMGDVVLATPMIAALRNRYKNAKISVVVRPGSAAALQKNKDVDEIIKLQPPHFGGKGSWRDFLRLANKSYDLVIEPHGDPRNILVAFLAGNLVWGFGSRGLGFLLNRKGVDRGHTISKLLQLVGGGSTATQWHDFDDKISKKLPAKYVVFAPETTKPEKEWKDSQWQELAKKIKLPIIVTGQKQQLSIDKAISLVGKTSPAQLASVLKKASIVVSVDSGTAHIAHAVRAPLLTLFGPENAKEWGYSDDKSIIIQHTSMGMTASQVGIKVRKLLKLR